MACGGDKAIRTDPGETRAAADLGRVPAQVDGHAVTLSEVSHLARAGELSPAEALKRLEARWLLYDEAMRRSPGHVSPEAETALEQALVQGLLRADVESVTVPDDALRAAYDLQAERFNQPERRASLHILAKLPADASADARARANAFAQRALPLLQDGPPADLKSLKEQAQQLGQGEPFEVVVENVPMVAQVGRLDKPYEDALFALPSEGLVAAPVESSFGVHAIYVTQVIPAKTQAFQEVRETLRDELLLDRRRAALETLLKTLRQEHPVVVHEDAAALLSEMTP